MFPLESVVFEFRTVLRDFVHASGETNHEVDGGMMHRISFACMSDRWRFF